MASVVSAIEPNITVNPNTHRPNMVWERMKNTIGKKKVDVLPIVTPIYPNKVRFVCVSDTHSSIHRMQEPIPSGDILIHAGDFSNFGAIEEIEKFSEFLKTLDEKFRYKVVIAGNHELSFELNPQKLNPSLPYDELFEGKQENPRDRLKNCIYLEDSMVQLFGINIYGSPWTPRFCDWAFNADRGGDILKYWNKIKDNTDILITHGPPLGFGDLVQDGSHQGCVELLSTVRERLKPKYHIFGHIHEDYGCWTDGVTTYINASICNVKNRPVNRPIIFDIDLPDKVEKNSFMN